MKTTNIPNLLAAALISGLALTTAHAADIPPGLTTPDKVETGIGTLEFKDVAPSAATKPSPPTGARTLDSRTGFYYGYTMDSPGMIMRLPNVGSQYLMGFTDADKNPFDGGKTYKVTLPKDIPAEKFWSFTVYDNQTRSMLQTPQRSPRAGSQTYPSPAAVADADGSTTVYFGPAQPDGVKRGNWIQTMPNQGWFIILRLYSPLEPFFTKKWRPSEIELVK